MRTKYLMSWLNPRQHRWLAVTLAAAVLWAQATQPIIAKRQPVEIAGTSLERDVVYKRVNGEVLTLNLYHPEKLSSPVPVII
jgi:hypothetical protein